MNRPSNAIARAFALSWQPVCPLLSVLADIRGHRTTNSMSAATGLLDIKPAGRPRTAASPDCRYCSRTTIA
jgi:hypothetical protein